MATQQLNTEGFKEKVFDYSKNKDWHFQGKKPAIIDFYADWCGPCKTIAPILEELSEEFKEVDIYKVDTEKEGELSAIFDIQSIPTLLFIPVDGQPMIQKGVLPKAVLQEVIQKELLKSKEK